MQEVRENAAVGWSWGRCALLVGLCLVVYLPGFFTIPPVDRDESRFAQASRQMFESAALPAGERDPALHGGGLLVPMVQDRPRLNKPPLIYWMQAASAAVCTGGDPMRDAIWMYRVPSLLAAVVTVLLTWRIGTGMLGERIGAGAAVLLAVCPMVAWEAHQARADMVLLVWTTGAMGAMWGVWKGEAKRRRDGETERRGDGEKGSSLGWAHAAVFWVCIAGGVMTKGPITPMVAGLAALALCMVTRRWAWLLGLRPLTGLCLAALLVAPWVVAVARRIGWSEYLSRIYGETIGRSVAPREGHWGPPGYHLVLLTLLLWPGSLLTGWALGRAWKDRAPPLLFCLCWAGPAWIVFELVGTKLPHYTLPLYPALAIVSAWGLGRLGGLPVLVKVGIVVWGLVGVGLSALPAVLARVGSGPVGLGTAASIVLGLVVLGSAVLGWRAHVKRAVEFAVAHMTVLAVVLFGVVLPRCPGLWVSRQLADRLGRAVRPVAAAGYHEDSLVFWTRGRMERIDESQAAAWREAHPRGVLIMPATAAGPKETLVEGLNYSNGKRVRLRVEGGLP